MILKAKPEHLDKIAKLHCDVLSDTSSSKFGYKFVKYLYQQLITDKNSCIWIYQLKNKTVGFISISTNMIHTTKLVKKSINLNGYLSMLLIFIKQPYEIIIFIQRLIFEYVVTKNLKQYANILTIGVSPINRNIGIGRSLIDKAEKYLKKNGIRKYYVDTESKNTTGINFYKNNDFKMIQSFYNNVLFKKNLS